MSCGIIAIDGGAGTGKGTTARGVAKALWYIYVDTGAMYRAVTLWCMRHDMQEATDAEIEAHLAEIQLQFVRQSNDTLHIHLNGEDIEDIIRTPDVDQRVAKISARQVVRNCLIAQQRLMANSGGVVMEGRDIATVVAPHAELKVFLKCDDEVRAQRRYQQFLAQWKQTTLEEVKEGLRKRDEMDYNGHNPTSRKAQDARELDTTHITIDEQIEIVLWRARELM